MTNITLDGLPAKTGTVSDAGIIHYREGGVDKKMTVADFLIRISEEYSADINTFLGAADKAAGRAALGIARITTVSNADYTILVTDKVVAQTGTMSAPRAWSLPTAADYPAGEELICIDQSGTVTPTNKITLSRASSDTIDGETSMTISRKYGILVLISDGVSKWKLKHIGSPLLLNSYTNKNLAINGGFDIWQRGTSFADTAGTRFADNWSTILNGAMRFTVARSTDVPTIAQSGRKFNYSAYFDCTTADASIAAGEYYCARTVIEGYNYSVIAEKEFTVSFWVKATKTGIYSISAKPASNDASCVNEFTINAVDTWEYKTVTFAAPASSNGTWNYTNGIGIEFLISLAQGSTYQTSTLNTWQNSNYSASTNQINACDSTSNDFRITGFQVEEGKIATPFEIKTFQKELSDCMRYFEKSYEYATPPETVTQVGQVVYSNQNGQANYIVVKYRVEKRTAPTVTISNPVAAGNSARNYSAGTNVGFTTGDNGASSFSGLLSSTASLSTIGIQWYSAAEL